MIPIDRRRRARKRRTFARAYGSNRRVWWVKTLPCVVCGTTPCDNAHTASGGMGRKADHRTIVPLCFAHHHELHQHGHETFAAKYHPVDLIAEARRIATDWDRLTATSPATPYQSEENTP